MTRHPLLDALIVATAEPSLAVKTASVTPGYVGVAKNGKSFMITATRNVSGKENYIAAFDDGEVGSISKDEILPPMEDMGDDLTPMGKISALVRLAYNADFDSYVKTAIEAKNLPTDPKMNWAKWLEGVYRSSVSPLKPELRDEAIHHMLIDNLYRYDAMARFDASRLPAQIQALPLEEQISSYLKGYFIQQKSDCINWIKKTYGDA
jgi:hypothetical protein